MQLEWVIEPQDVAKVRDLVARSEGEPLVQERRQLNLGNPGLTYLDPKPGR